MTTEIRITRNIVTNADGAHARWVYSWEPDQEVTWVTPPSVYVPKGSTTVYPAGVRTEHGQSLAHLRQVLKLRIVDSVRFVQAW